MVLVEGVAAMVNHAFSRVTSTGVWIPQVDGLRFVAMLLVLGHHVFAAYLEQTHRLGTQQLPRDWATIAPRSPLIDWVLHLAFAVPLFFVLSGFVLTIPFAHAGLAGKPRLSWRRYLLRRLVRLEPPYVLNLLLLFLVITVPTHLYSVFAPHLAASLIYLHGVVYADASWINGVAWTLEIEVQFYLLLPFFAELFRIRHAARRRTAFVALILGSALAVQFWIAPHGGERLNLTLVGHAHYFLAGILLADLYLEKPAWLAPGSPLADLLTLTSAAALVYVLHWEPRLTWSLPLVTVALCLGSLLGAWSSRLFQLRALTLCGGMSYTFYLYHFLIIRQLLPLTVRWFPPAHALWWDAAVQFALILPPVLAISAVLFYLTERPFMILSKRWSAKAE